MKGNQYKFGVPSSKRKERKPADVWPIRPAGAPVLQKISAAAYERIVAACQNPPAPSQELRDLMQGKGVAREVDHGFVHQGDGERRHDPSL